jgi:hypothetical protein
VHAPGHHGPPPKPVAPDCPCAFGLTVVDGCPVHDPPEPVAEDERRRLANVEALAQSGSETDFALRARMRASFDPLGTAETALAEAQEQVEAIVSGLIPRDRVRVGVVEMDGHLTTADGRRWVEASVLERLREADPDWYRACMDKVVKRG